MPRCLSKLCNDHINLDDNTDLAMSQSLNLKWKCHLKPKWKNTFSYTLTVHSRLGAYVGGMWEFQSSLSVQRMGGGQSQPAEPGWVQGHTPHPGMSVAFGLPERCPWLPSKAYRLVDKLQNFVNSSYLNHYSKAAKDMATFICQIQISSGGIGKKRQETKWWAYLFLLSWYVCLQVFWKCAKSFLNVLSTSLSSINHLDHCGQQCGPKSHIFNVKICVDLRRSRNISWSFLQLFKMH